MEHRKERVMSEHKSADQDVLQEVLDEIGALADLCDNMQAAAVLPFPPSIHIEAMTANYVELRTRLRAAYVKLSSGEDPWK
jgi:hypothetical protein